ncbi:MAG: hypothetical protein D6760_00690, partial [Deltaproteobacteria bacterium]
MPNSSLSLARRRRSFAKGAGSLILLALGLLLSARPATAGIADTPLPTFTDGKPSVLVHSVTGVIRRAGIDTVFLCTSFE